MKQLLARYTQPRWLLIFASIVLAIGLGALNGLGRLDQTLIDLSAARQQRAIDPDIVIIAIDDDSVAQLGRWPWPRSTHAALLDRLHSARAIGLDLILSEPDAQKPANDDLLAAALRRNGRVALPVFLANQGGVANLTLPLPSLAANAATLAHINTELDRDGLVRSVFLQEGDANAPWNHLALALLQIGGELPQQLPGQRHSDIFPADSKLAVPIHRDKELWLRDYWLRLPLAGAPGTYPRYSYADVLNGKVNPELFRDKYVLIGATATGLGDAYPTPMAGSQALMPGVELIANTLDAVRKQHTLRLAAAWENALFTLVAVGLALWALQKARPKWALLAIASLLIGTVVYCELMQRYLHIQFAPLAALLILLVLYPLWSWLRMEAALRYFAQQVSKIRQEDPLLATLPNYGVGLDLLDKKMAALSHAVDQLSSLRRFVRDSLDQLADTVLVCDANGKVILQNQAAQRFFSTPVLNQLLPAQLSQMIPNKELLIANLFSPAGASWRASDRQGRDMLVKSVARQTESGRVIGWIVSMVDLSLVQAAQRQRDEALDFLSHDMRSPQSAILALLTLHQSAHPNPDSSHKTLFERIAAHAQRTLQLADDFVQLARANSANYQIEPVDLLDLMYETSDQFWEKAQLLNLNINTVSHLPDPELAIYPVDRVMLGRALSNLIDNALKYGHTGDSIDCSVSILENNNIELSVQDYGGGIAADQQSRITGKFTQVASRNNGVGLGLAFVRTVAERHRGEIKIQSKPGEGSRFSIVLPKINA